VIARDDAIQTWVASHKPFETGNSPSGAGASEQGHLASRAIQARARA
jgi:hypothetical protein